MLPDVARSLPCWGSSFVLEKLRFGQLLIHSTSQRCRIYNKNMYNKIMRPMRNLSITFHPVFLECWNTQKSICSIWHCFSCLLDESIAKKFNFFSQWLFEIIRIICFEMHMDRPVLSDFSCLSMCTSKKIMWIISKSQCEIIFCIFLQFSCQVDMKNVAKCCKHLWDRG